MNTKKYKLWCGVAAAAVMLTGISGCKGNTVQNTAQQSAGSSTMQQEEAENTFAYEDETKEVPTSKTVMGRVENISGNTISLSVGEGPGGEKPEGIPDGEKPEGAPDGEKPDRSSNGEKTDGEMPRGNMQQAAAVLTINDTSVLTSSETESVSLGDITAGTMLCISFDENGKIISIEIGKERETSAGQTI